VDPKLSQNTNVSLRKKQQQASHQTSPVIHNLSKRELTDIEEKSLSRGLSYGIANKNINEFEPLARYEVLANTLNDHKQKTTEPADKLQANQNNKSAFFQQLQTHMNNFIKNSKRIDNNLSRAEHQALETLSKDKSIIISGADKGKAVVIQDASKYENKVHQIVNMKDKFRLLKKNPTNSRETKLIALLGKMKARMEDATDKEKITKTGINKQTYWQMYPSGSKPGVLYGLPKIHKAGAPIRPIISAIGTYNYKLAKVLNQYLEPLVDKTYMLKDTFEFVNKVRDLDTNSDQYLVSFDVESLYTNIPITETIDIILRLAYPDENTEFFHDIRKEDLKKLLIICAQESHFIFRGKYYDQTDGVAMGSPLGPLFASIFMSDFERKHMESLKNLGLRKWLRYVDDVFASFSNKEQAETVLNHLNVLHNNIKFTIEHEENGKLPILDTTIERRVGKYITTLYRKKTFTGVYLNWTSLTAKRYKLGLIKNLTNRILRICMDPKDIETELAKMKTTLEKNEYPRFIIDREVNMTIEKWNSRTENPQEKTEKKKVFITLPYTNSNCDKAAE
jgi:hypothetical protein